MNETVKQKTVFQNSLQTSANMGKTFYQVGTEKSYFIKSHGAVNYDKAGRNPNQFVDKLN